MGLLQKVATWGRQLTQYQCFHSRPVLPGVALCFTGGEGMVVGQGLNEVQAHPPHTEKVMSTLSFMTKLSFSLKSHI